MSDKGVRDKKGDERKRKREDEPEPEPESESQVKSENPSEMLKQLPKEEKERYETMERILTKFMVEYLYDINESRKFVDNIMKKYPFDKKEEKRLISKEISEYDAELTREGAKAFGELESFFEYESDEPGDPDASLKKKRSKKRKKKRKSKKRKSKRKHRKTKKISR